MTRMLALCAAMALVLGAPRASAAELKVLGAKLDLPFAYKLIESGESLESDRDGLVGVEGREIEVLDGPLQGKRLRVVGRYWSPSFTDAALLRKSLGEIAAKDAAREATRDTGEVRIDNYTFHFSDRSSDDKKDPWPERMTMMGEVSAAMLSLQIHAKDVASLTPEVEQALKTAKLDFETLVRVRGRFDAEARAAKADTALETPLGSIDLGKKHRAQLVFSSMQRDAEGRQLSRTRTYYAQRVPGFWAASAPVLMTFACMVDSPEALEETLSLYDDDTTKPVEQRSVQTGGRVATKFLGTDAMLVTGKGPSHLGTRPSIRRLALAKDGTIYTFTVMRGGGSGVEEDVEKLLVKSSPQCRTDLAMPGDDANAPRPAAGNDAAPRVSSR